MEIMPFKFEGILAPDNAPLILESDILSYSDNYLDEVIDIRFFINKSQQLHHNINLDNMNKIYKSIFCLLKEINLNQNQLNDFKESANYFQDNNRFINSSIFFHFIKDYLNCANNLISMKLFDLAFVYSNLNNLNETLKISQIKKALNWISKGDILNSIVLLINIKEYHIALHFLFINKLFFHMKIILIEAKNNNLLIKSNFEIELIPLEEIIRFCNESILI